MKRYALPTIKVLIALVVAVTLTKIAFFPSQDQAASADITPGYKVATQTTTVSVGDISNTIDIKGQVVEDAVVEIPADLAGVVDSFAVDKDTWVEAGSELLYLKHTEPQEPITSTDAEGNTTSTKVPDKVTWSTIYAPVSGTVTFKVIRAQDTSVGMTVATIAPGTYSATGTITASQQYRLTDAPSSALVTVEGGPSPFECTNLKIGTKANTSTTTSNDGTTTTTTGDGTSVQVRCSIPADQQVFAGLPATIGIDAGSATGVPLVPITAVEGTVGTGSVWVVTDPAKPEAAEKRTVTLGLTDGTNVEITEGLSEGEEILLFVPGKDTLRTGEPNTCEPDGSACYDENGQEIL